MTQYYNYEFPLGEFIRTCLKIDRLQSVFVGQTKDDNLYIDADHRNLLMRVLELYSLVSRPELKNELIKEIEKRLLKLNKLKNIPGIDSSTLNDTLSSLNSALRKLKAIPTDSYAQPMPYLIDSYKQRMSVPGGQFEFDLPMIQYWLNHHSNDCHEKVIGSIAGFSPIIETVQLLLRLLRQSATARKLTADNGIYQLTDNNDYELIIISIPKQLSLYPEISGGRHRVFIRFLEYLNMNEKPQQSNKNIAFQLTCCRI